jgi:hypothetical protein
VLHLPIFLLCPSQASFRIFEFISKVSIAVTMVFIWDPMAMLALGFPNFRLAKTI